MSAAPNLQHIAALRAELWHAGYRPLAVFRHDHPDRERAGKAPLGAQWRERALRDPPEVVTLPAVAHAPNTGVLCDGLRALDADIDDREVAARVRALAQEMLGDVPMRVRDNSPRFLMPYRAAVGQPRKLALAGRKGKIEILGQGQQFVAHGWHPTGAELRWVPVGPEQMAIANLPAVTEEQITEFLLAAAPLIEADPPAGNTPHNKEKSNGQDGPHVSVGANAALLDILDVMAALAVIPNDGPADWECWNNVGMAVWLATAGSVHGFNAWCAWSTKHPEHDQDACRERWDHYFKSPPDRTGAGKLYAMAAKVLPRWQRPSETQQRAHEIHLRADAWGWEDQPDLECVGLPPTAKELLPPRPWAYGFFLMFGVPSVIGAVDGGGKGAIAVVMALAMITGRPLLGEKVWRTGPVAIITYEDDELEWHRRIWGACAHYQVNYASAIAKFRFIRCPGGRVSFARLAFEEGKLRTQFPHGDAIVKELRAIDAALLIVDPFNHSHELDDGNNNVMIAKVAAEMTRIARESNAAVLVLHHLRKGASGDPDDLMGATSLRATFRATRILKRMTPEEGNKRKITDGSWRYIRIAGSKENYAPPPDRQKWYRLISMPLGNATHEYEQGDEVAVATVWEPRPMFDGMPHATLAAVFGELRRGDFNPNRQAKNWAGKVLMGVGERSEDEAAKIIAAWLTSGVLTKVECYSPAKHTVQAVVLNEAKAAEILASLGYYEETDTNGETCV